MTIIVAILGWRVGLLVGISIPTTYLLSITILNFMGMSYNLMSIMGLVLSVGLLVDGPIVITEYAEENKKRELEDLFLILMQHMICFIQYLRQHSQLF